MGDDFVEMHVDGTLDPFTVYFDTVGEICVVVMIGVIFTVCHIFICMPHGMWS